MKRSPSIPFLIIAAVSFNACRHVENSDIVLKFKAAGGGDPDKANVGQISAWLSKHEPVRQQLNLPCTLKRKAAPADWANTDEGRVCDGVAQATFFAPVRIVPDGVKF